LPGNEWAKGEKPEPCRPRSDGGFGVDLGVDRGLAVPVDEFSCSNLTCRESEEPNWGGESGCGGVRC